MEIEVKNKILLKGSSITPGIAIGEVHVFKRIELEVLARNKLPVDDMRDEEERLDRALEESRGQLYQIQVQTFEKAGKDIRDIFSSHRIILNDINFLKNIKKRMVDENANAEYVIANQIKRFEETFSTIENDIIRNRFADIEDVYYRVLRNLLGIEHVRVNPMTRLDKPVILVSERLIPSDIALIDMGKILGIVVEHGSNTSHVAIISKSLIIPAVFKVFGVASLIKSGDSIIVDGYNGRVLINPVEEDIKFYQEKQHRYKLQEAKLVNKHEAVKCVTRDGIRVKLEANISTVGEAKEAVIGGAEDIGLLRTEIFYMTRKKMPSIDEEYDFYKQLFNIVDKKTLTVRLLDLGADKSLPYLSVADEQNPQLGCRGIRFLLQHPDIFRKHLQSIFYASKLGDLRILIPFVSIVEDIDEAINIIHEVMEKVGLNRSKIKIGIMVEIPSAALALNTFIEKIDFINIGTNDLIQYLFAISRDNDNLEKYRQHTHPAVMKLIKSIVETANEHNKEVSVCGEIVGDPRVAKLMVGLGVRNLSMQPKSISGVRKEISKSYYGDMEKSSERSLNRKKWKSRASKI
jgi:phosphotransferase system enzyme I (PtsI)